MNKISVAKKTFEILESKQKFYLCFAILEKHEYPMKKEWNTLWSNKGYLAVWVSFLLLVLCTLKMISRFLVFNEYRSGGCPINDWVLNALVPADVSTPLFAITWICIIGCLPIALRTPKQGMMVFISIIIIGILRCICLYLVPLMPPEGIIPLRDTLLEGSFYENQVLVRDLFFSGHTANLALLTFLVDIKWLKFVLGICTCIVAFLLLKQHVHYTIDIIAAPFAAFVSYRLAKLIVKFILSKVTYSKVTQKACLL